MNTYKPLSNNHSASYVTGTVALAFRTTLILIDLESLEIIDEFQRFVRPQINPTLTDFCKKLTSIQQMDVDGARTYPEAGEDLRTFVACYPKRGLGVMG